MRLALLATIAATLALPVVAAAQDLSPYIPVNPVLASRSALYAQPMVPVGGWHLRLVTDYSNAIEYEFSRDRRRYLFDAEILQSDLWLTRDLSRRVFVVGDLSVRGGYNGVLDGFLNWYHDLFGLTVTGRSERPENQFGWQFTLPDTVVTRARPGTFLGDVRAGAGVRVGRSQLIGSVTLPTTPSSADGWGRGVVGTSLALTSNLLRTPRVMLDGEATLGWTPTHGALARYQRSVFAGGALALRWRVVGQQA